MNLMAKSNFIVALFPGNLLMHSLSLPLLCAVCVTVSIDVSAADEAEKAANEEIRAAIPYGGNFDPKPEQGIFVAAGHGMNVVVSRDDGKTWEQVFMGRPGGDHGHWAVWNNVAYAGGVFAIASGWGAPGTILASDDGKNWRHLADENRDPRRDSSKPYDMPTTMEFIGVKDSFIMPLLATPDFGKTWFETSRYHWNDAAGNKGISIDTGHPTMAYADYEGGRVIVLGDKGPGIYSDDLGKTWIAFTGVDSGSWEERGAKGIIGKDGLFLIVQGDGSTARLSKDGGMTWESHPLGVGKPNGLSFSLSVLGDFFVVAGNNAKASADGITWKDLPETTPPGRFAVSDTGTMINVTRGRKSILRSTDGKDWETVYEFESKGEGGAQGLADVGWGKVKALK